MSDNRPANLEICFSPALYSAINTQMPFSVVVVDILRATTAMCSALSKGLKEIIPVASLDEARAMKAQGYLVAAEREGDILDFADYGNSPLDYQHIDLAGKTLVYSTTNGTQAIKLAENAEEVLLGAYVNLDVLVQYLLSQQKDLVILCSGWKDQFSLEDAVFAGALAARLLEGGNYVSRCDSVAAALGLWQQAAPDLLNYHHKASHTHRLKEIGQDASIPFCFQLNACEVVPGLVDGRIVDVTGDR
jgi:2-phosphosulfolactate phosphatase